MCEIKQGSILKPDEVILKRESIVMKIQDLHDKFLKKYIQDCRNARACTEGACWLLQRGLCLSHLFQANPQELYDLL